MNQIYESLLRNMSSCPEKADINPELGVVAAENWSGGGSGASGALDSVLYVEE